ncbi:MAG: toll/interleukin-1 receptor domain-containing protein [Methylobacter sp.]|nr:toll/interleukin-1 receptor domain-containing protein [Methylobacter sp.]
MPISISQLEAAARRSSSYTLLDSVNEALAANKQTAFLCHSHKDEKLAEGLQVLLAENGWSLYIDWQDHEMPPQPNKITAFKIKNKIEQLDWFLFLATPNSSASRWCPWEIGIADTKKSHERIVIIPTTDNSGNWYGNEYLQLYNQIDFAQAGKLAKFPAGQTTGGTFVQNLR